MSHYSPGRFVMLCYVPPYILPSYRRVEEVHCVVVEEEHGDHDGHGDDESPEAVLGHRRGALVAALRDVLPPVEARVLAERAEVLHGDGHAERPAEAAATAGLAGAHAAAG